MTPLCDTRHSYRRGVPRETGSLRGAEACGQSIAQRFATPDSFRGRDLLWLPYSGAGWQMDIRSPERSQDVCAAQCCSRVHELPAPPRTNTSDGCCMRCSGTSPPQNGRSSCGLGESRNIWRSSTWSCSVSASEACSSLCMGSEAAAPQGTGSPSVISLIYAEKPMDV